ncbi:MAG: DUF4954 family protein [Planctomycetota bacterium]|jgi:hypothetical protein|nr:DUF4954 family protein [Planctomycetota bacterium]
MNTRSLGKKEIARLEANGCSSTDWGSVRVAAAFEPGDNIRDSSFSGRVVLGSFAGEFFAPSGLPERPGIMRARLHDAAVGDNALVRDAVLARTDVGEQALVDRVDRIAAIGKTAYGNGMAANVLTEHGGRSVPLWRRLSSQLAHLLCHLKGSPEAAALVALVEADVAGIESARSFIGARSRVERSGLLVNVRLEEGSLVLGAAGLNDCHLAGRPGAPAVVGAGVAACGCVFLAGSSTIGGVRLERCLVGEGVELKRGFSAEHSLFFANCAFAQGEAASAMCGPFVDSHHKATLVLTCQTSFSTFGSMANGSNNHFKIGPLHGGVLRRGAKPGSGSYLFWPADIGAFSTVIGRHLSNLDTADFPFSLVVGEGARTTLAPGVAVFGSGVWRDERKWLARDRRGGIDKPLDLYTLSAMSPFVMQSMDRGVAKLAAAAARGGDFRTGGAVVPEGRFDPARALYSAAALVHVGRRALEAARRKNGGRPPTLIELLAVFSLRDDGRAGGDWRDWGGLLVSGDDAEAFFADLRDGRIASPEELDERFALLHGRYLENEWLWLAGRWRTERGEPDAGKVARFLREVRDAVVFRLECLKKDVLKEFSTGSRYGYGLERDGDADFAQSRGVAEEHAAYVEMEKETLALLDGLDSVIEEGGRA